MTDSEKLDLLLADMAGMKQDFGDVKQDLGDMKQDLGGMKQELRDVQQELADVKQRVSNMEMILENEIRVNIKRVAEGHLDLSRNLHEAMKPNQEIEMLAIRVGVLESDMREVKAKIS